MTQLNSRRFSDLATYQAGAKAEIDEKAGEVRQLYITVVPGQAETYMQKLQECETFKANAYDLNSGSYPWVQAEATAQAMTEQAAADNVLAIAGQWDTVGPNIEEARLKAKRLIMAATTVEQVIQERQTGMTALDALKP